MELIGAVLVFACMLRRKERYQIRFLGMFMSIVVINTIFTASLRLMGLVDAVNILLYGVWIFTIFASVVIGVWFCFKVEWKEAIYCGTCAYLTEHIAFCIRILFNWVTRTTYADAGHLIYVLIHVLVYILFYYLFAKKMVRGHHYEASVVQSVGLMFSVLLLVLVMSMVSSQFGFQRIHAMYAIFCCIIVLYSQIYQVKQLALQQELNNKEQLWMKHQAQYEMSKENIDIINRKCHDLKHQVAALRTISNQECQEEVIDSIEKSIMIYDSIMDTGNETLDTVLTEKSLLCNEKNIIITCITDGKLLEFMDIIDTYTLFGNALDNAIEGVSKFADIEQRHIGLIIHKKVDLIFIQFENPYTGEIKMKDGLPVSDKPNNGYHGFGVKSIQQVAEKYDGFITIETVGQIFVLRVTIPVNSR